MWHCETSLQVSLPAAGIIGFHFPRLMLVLSPLTFPRKIFWEAELFAVSPDWLLGSGPGGTLHSTGSQVGAFERDLEESPGQAAAFLLAWDLLVVGPRCCRENPRPEGPGLEIAELPPLTGRFRRFDGPRSLFFSLAGHPSPFLPCSAYNSLFRWPLARGVNGTPVKETGCLK